MEKSETLFNIEKYIDFSSIKNIIEQNKGKELICFGGGTAADILMRKLLYQYPVSCFLDNNQKIWGQEIHGVPIVNPEVLKNKNKERIVVLLLSKWGVDISFQLQEYGLEKNVQFFDVYSKFNSYFRMTKFDDTTKRYLEHLSTIPQHTFSNVVYQTQPVIGVVCVASMAKLTVWYAIEQCLILRKNGYRAICIVDLLKSFDDYIYFDGYAEVVGQYIQYVLEQVKVICPDFEVLYINSADNEELTESDHEKITYLADKMLEWYDAWKDELFLPEQPDRISVAKEILLKNFVSIKAFFMKYQFDTINVFTGMHKHRCLYSYVSELYNIRMSCYDGNDSAGPIRYAAQGMAGHSEDCARLLIENWFEKEELDCLYHLAQEEFAERISSTYKDKEDYYQLVGDNGPIEKPYDIIMPLNVTWDAAALGLDYLFTDAMNWLVETVTYIMEHTDATVMIREHPAQAHVKEYNYINLVEQLNELKKYGDRVWICKADEKINSYQYIRQCKVVLPYSSTIGLESVGLGKKIVVHTKCYYSVFGFANACSSKEEYFLNIKKFYENEYEITVEEKREALCLLSILSHSLCYTIFTEADETWLSLSWEDLQKEKGVSEIIDTIAKNIPYTYHNLKEVLKIRNAIQSER